MTEWVVLSGKGGTGKTSVAAALAHLASQEVTVALADADVDAANLELVLSPDMIEEHDFSGGQVAVIDPRQCTSCGRCAEVCRFGAIPLGGPYAVDALACEGCAACYYACPVGAIRTEDQLTGHWYRSDSLAGPLVHARLRPGKENSGKLVMQVKMVTRALAVRTGADLLLVDGPPGIGCPVIAAASGANLALLVTEPTVSGRHDLERILGTARHFRVPAAVCVNKADLSLSLTQEIESFCRNEGVPMVGRVPFDEAVVRALVNRRPVTMTSSGPAAEALVGLWRNLRDEYLVEERRAEPAA